jgi:uncharacterized membrane protein YukC
MKLADRIILHLLKYGRKDPNEIMIPNFYHFMYEMDMFKLTKKQWVVEYEVKISRSDYFNDFKKHYKAYKQPPVYKHQELQQGRAANSFFFIVPAGLVDKTEVPHYAGLMYYLDHGVIETIKPAPVIHKNIFTDYQALATSLSWREDRWRRKLYRDDKN